MNFIRNLDHWLLPHNLAHHETTFPHHLTNRPMVSSKQQHRTKGIILEPRSRFRLSGSIYRVLKVEKGGKQADVIRESVNVPTERRWPGINENKPFKFDVNQLNRWADFEILKQNNADD